MPTISTKEAAARWGVSVREVQRLLLEGRIPGAARYGNYWTLPADAQKPQDRRVAPVPLYAFVPALPLPRKDPDAVLAGLTGDALVLIRADLAYRRGDVEPAKAAWRNDPARADLPAAAILATTAAISSGDYALYYDIQRFLEERLAAAPAKRDAALLSLPKALACVSMALPEMTPDWLKACDFSRFSADLKPFLLFLYSLHLRNIGDRAGQLATARATALLCEQGVTFTWLELYLWLLCASACAALGDTAEAVRYLRHAMDLGLPCGFLMPFADTLGDFGGLMESCLERYYPALLTPILEIWESSFKNWMRFHNAFSKANISTILTPREYHVARLLASGETYAGAARRMSLSVGRVKNLASVVYAKLHIKKREELKPFVL